MYGSAYQPIEVLSKNLLIPLYSNELCVSTLADPSANNMSPGLNSSSGMDKVRIDRPESAGNQKIHTLEKQSEGQPRGQGQEEGKGQGQGQGEGEGENEGVYAEISAVKQMLTKQQELCGGRRLIFHMLCVWLCYSLLW